MQSIFNMTYIAIALAFIRSIIDKCTYESRLGLPVEHNDNSGCWCLVYGNNVCIDYSHDKFGIMQMANDIINRIPKLRGQLKLLEDDDLGISDLARITILNDREIAIIDKLINEYDL